MRTLAGWGRTQPVVARVVTPASEDDVATILADAAGPVIARGLGRSYGDAAQAAGGTVVDGRGFGAVGTIDPSTGSVTVGAGASIDAILAHAVPKGWFVPVSPGTRQVTVGGAIAADVHGKNHHRDGSIGTHLRSLILAAPTGTCRLTPEDDLFWATVGGMGLTGVILEAEVALPRIPSATLLVDTDRTDDLDGVLDLMERGDDAYHYSVAWIDCLARGRHLGRSVLTRGDFAAVDDLPTERRRASLAYHPTVRVQAPPLFPSGVVNAWSMRAFNEAWYRKAPRCRRAEPQSIPTFFHPLDGVGGWNRLYGGRGFLQYQFVVPFGEEGALRAAIGRLADAGAASALAVLKRFGPANRGPLSFPQPGWTLALDLPVTPELAGLLDGLDELVAVAGGRVYLAKDSRLRPELLPVMYPRLAQWRAQRDRADPDAVLASDLDRRLHLTGRR